MQTIKVEEKQQDNLSENKNETDRKIALFKQCVLKYAKLFNLAYYQITISERFKEEAAASCYSNPGAGMATISYSVDWVYDENTTDAEIEKTAFHEVMELLLSRLTVMATNINMPRTDEGVDHAAHMVIRTLENVVLPMIQKEDN